MANSKYGQPSSKKKMTAMPLVNSWKLTKSSAVHFWVNRMVYLKVVGIFGVAYLLLARELSGLTLVGGDSETSLPVTDSTALYYTIILTLVSLATIWLLRRAWAGEPQRVKQAFYSGMGAIVPFLITNLLLIIMLLPLALGNLIYGTVVQNSIASSKWELGVWAVVYFLSALASLYLLSSAIFAPYIVTMEGVSPIQAIRSSWAVVRHRRLAIIRRVLFLVVLISIMGGIFLLPFLVYLPLMVETLYWLFSGLALVYGHIYMYSLYRELL